MTQAESGERGAHVRFPPPFVYQAFILLGVGLRYGVAPLRVPTYVAIVRTVGIVVVLAGLWLGADAWKLFKRTGQDPAPWKPSPELVLRGIYRFTRNPMYVVMTCIQVDLGLVLNNLWIALLAALSLATVHFIAVLRRLTVLLTGSLAGNV